MSLYNKTFEIGSKLTVYRQDNLTIRKKQNNNQNNKNLTKEELLEMYFTKETDCFMYMMPKSLKY